MRDPVAVRDVPEEYRVEILGDEIRVWNGSHGRRHSLEKLAPFTDTDGSDE